MKYQLQMPIGNLPIHLVLVGNKDEGRVVFVQVRPVGFIIEGVVEGRIGAMFDSEGFAFADNHGNAENFEYDTVYDYKNIPLMLQWLQQQNLQEPEVVLG